MTQVAEPGCMFVVVCWCLTCVSSKAMEEEGRNQRKNMHTLLLYASLNLFLQETHINKHRLHQTMLVFNLLIPPFQVGHDKSMLFSQCLDQKWIQR